MERIKINDGKKEYEIVNQNDEVLGSFRFNPADTNIVEKYNGIVECLESFSPDPQKKATEAFTDAGNLLKEKMNDLFGEDTSKTFFSITGPFTPLSNGQFFVESILEGIGAVIEKEMKVRLKKVRERMNKYTDKYK